MWSTLFSFYPYDGIEECLLSQSEFYCSSNSSKPFDNVVDILIDRSSTVLIFARISVYEGM